MESPQVTPHQAGEYLWHSCASSQKSTELTLGSFFCSGYAACWSDLGVWTSATLHTSPPAAFSPSAQFRKRGAPDVSHWLFPSSPPVRVPGGPGLSHMHSHV